MSTLSIYDIISGNGYYPSQQYDDVESRIRYNVFLRASEDERLTLQDAPVEWLKSAFPTAEFYGPQFREMDSIIEDALTLSREQWNKMLTVPSAQYGVSEMSKTIIKEVEVSVALTGSHRNEARKVLEKDVRVKSINDTISVHAKNYLLDVLIACSLFDLCSTLDAGGVKYAYSHNSFVAAVNSWNSVIHLPRTFGYVRYLWSDGHEEDSWVNPTA